MNAPTTSSERKDFQIITDWIKPNSRVLDLGCNDGSLLKTMREQKQASGYGLELDTKSIPLCIKNQVNVIQMNLDKGLTGFDDQSFDYVVLSLTLQSIKKPLELVEDMLRVGREGIVSFPNFGHWSVRAQLAFKGKMPVSNSLPHRWHDTPNIRLCTVKDFEYFCQTRNIHILESRVLDNAYKSNFRQCALPNLFGNIAMYRISKYKQ